MSYLVAFESNQERFIALVEAEGGIAAINQVKKEVPGAWTLACEFTPNDPQAIECVEESVRRRVWGDDVTFRRYTPAEPVLKVERDAAFAHRGIDNETLTSTFAPLEQLQPADATAALLSERGKTHGRFEDHARCTGRMRELIHTEMKARQERGQLPMLWEHYEALCMIAHKIGRIIAGDPTFADHWDDIGGYARLGREAKRDDA